MVVKLEMLRCFVEVVDRGALSSAADALGKTPAAVSMTLKQFEETLGFPLFETSRKSKLTNFGELVYAEARRSVRQFENSVSVIQGLSRSQIGYLRILAIPSVANNILPPLISGFMEQYSGIRIHIQDLDSASIAHEMRRGRADIGIGTLARQGELERHPWFSDDFGVVCRQDHPLVRHKDHLELENLRACDLIANGLGDLIPDAEFRLLVAEASLQVPSISALFGLIREGVGVSVLPRLAATRLPEELTFLSLNNVGAPRVVSILSQPKNHLMPAALKFLDFIQSPDALSAEFFEAVRS